MSDVPEPLSTKVIVAIIVGAFAVYSGALAAVGNWFVQRKVNEGLAAAERLKADLAVKSRRRGVLEGEAEEGLRWVENSVRAVQEAKDAILLTVSYDIYNADAGKRLNSAMDEVIKAYKLSDPHLSTLEAQALHEAKSVTVEVKHMVTILDQGEGNWLEVKAELLRCRVKLSELQSALRDSRRERLLAIERGAL